MNLPIAAIFALAHAGNDIGLFRAESACDIISAVLNSLAVCNCDLAAVFGFFGFGTREIIKAVVIIAVLTVESVIGFKTKMSEYTVDFR